MTDYCHFCGEALNAGDVGLYKLINGWVPIRLQGGSNTVALSSDPLSWAHGACIDEERQRIKKPKKQDETLF